MSRYFTVSRSAWYSYLFVLPLLALYEGGLLLVNYGRPLAVVNGADAILQTILYSLGARGWAASVAFATLAAGVIIYFTDSRTRRAGGRPVYFACMLAESALYALIFGTMVSLLTLPFLPGTWTRLQLGEVSPPTFGQQLAVSLGAGIYEELLFRVLLMGGAIWILRRLGWPQGYAVVAAALGSSLVFSLFHYVGPFASPLEWPSFVFRWMAGLALAGLYGLRGFGIAVYTHSLYDVFLLIAGR